MNILKINGQALEGIYVDAAISFNKPAKRVSTYSVPGRNGDLVIDEGTFDNVLITYPVFEKSTFPTEFDAIVNYLASLEGYQRIECSNDPQHYRLGRFVVPQNPTAKRLNRDGYWQLSFDCKPQRWLLSGEEDTEIDANPIDEYSGDIVSFDAVALDEITELKAAIEPVQDLNGQTSPYPAGGGKNLLNPTGTTTTSNGITFTVNADGTVTANGEATAQATLNYSTTDFVSAITGSYLFNGNPSGASSTTYRMKIRFYSGSAWGSWSYANSTSDLSVNPSSATKAEVQILVLSGQTVSNLVFKPMLRLATDTDPTFAPYSNICPISGWTEVNVVRTGKNLLKNRGTSGSENGITWTMNEDGSVTFGGTASAATSINFNILADSLFIGRGTMSLVCNKAASYNPSITGVNFQTDIYKDSVYVGTLQSGNTKLTVSNANRVGIGLSRIRIQSGTVVPDGTVFYPQVEIGSDPTAYEPYAGQTYPISLGQTVYGGTLNVTTGVLTITHGMYEFTGNETWYAYGSGYRTVVLGSAPYKSIGGTIVPTGVICEMLAPNARDSISGGAVGVALTGDTVIVSTNAGIAGKKLVYELATPTTVQLTAAEVELLLGQNNIWADTGDVEVKVTSPTNFINPSLFNSKPLIRVYGIGTFRVNDITVTIASHDKPYIDIDCELQECYYEGENMNAYVSFSGNDFPELEPGNNYMLLASGITRLDVTPRWWIL